MLSIFDAIAQNERRTWLLMTVMGIILLALGYFLGRYFGIGYWGILPAGILSVGLNYGSYFGGADMILYISGATPVSRDDYPHLVNSVEGLAMAAGIHTPKIYMLRDTAPNAFATGRDQNHSIICVTSGLLEKLNRVELEGVLAHEMSHIRNRDILLMSVVAVSVGAIALLSDWLCRLPVVFSNDDDSDTGGSNPIFAFAGLILALLAPIAAMLIQIAISRQREYEADATGAMLTRYPEGLACALEKIQKDTEPLEAANKATAPLYFVNPLYDIGGTLNSLFDTHPPTDERIKRLRAM